VTPAIKHLEKAKIKYKIHAYEHDPGSKAYGEEAAEKLNVSFDRVFKTLVISIDNNKLSIALVPVSRQLNLKSFAKALGSKKAGLADKKDAERATGYITGGISPIGQKKKIETIIDSSVLKFDTVYVSAGRRGLQIELSPEDLRSKIDASYYGISK